MSIILYDIPSIVSDKAFSPNVWKVRFCLNYKNLPYKTEWVELPDIEATCKLIGIPPSSRKLDGSYCYTLPAILDTETGAALSESFLIAQYLEGVCPLPSIFPQQTVALQSCYDTALCSSALASLSRFLVFDTYLRLSTKSAEYYRLVREKMFGGMALENIPPKEEHAVMQWDAFKAGMGVVNMWYKKSGGPFLMGESPSWADFLLAARLTWAKKIWGEHHPRWTDIISWHDGRWGALLGALGPFSEVKV